MLWRTGPLIRLRVNIRRGTFWRWRTNDRFRYCLGSIRVNNGSDNLLGTVGILDFGRCRTASMRDAIHGCCNWSQRSNFFSTKEPHSRAIRRRRAATAFRGTHDAIVGTDRSIEVLLVERTSLDTIAAPSLPHACTEFVGFNETKLDAE